MCATIKEGHAKKRLLYSSQTSGITGSSGSVSIE